MSGLKDSLNNKVTTVTLGPTEINFLAHTHNFIQAELDRVQEHLAAQYLSYLAISKFGLDPKKSFQFEYHPERESDNLVITEVITPEK